MGELIKQETEKQVVNRLLRCRRTHRYFKDGGWIEDPRQASTFPDEMEAIRACVQNGLENVELVLRVPGSTTDLFSTPVR